MRCNVMKYGDDHLGWCHVIGSFFFQGEETGETGY